MNDSSLYPPNVYRVSEVAILSSAEPRFPMVFPSPRKIIDGNAFQKYEEYGLGKL